MLLLLLVTIFLSVWVKKNAYQVLYMSIYYEWYGSSYVIYIYIYIPLKKRPPPLLKQEPNSLANMARMCFTRHWDMYNIYRVIL